METGHNEQAPGAQAGAACVEKALLRLCRGYTYREETYEKCRKPVTEDGRKVGDQDVVQRIQLTRRREPSLEAIKLWLSLHPPGPAAGPGPVYVVDDVACAGAGAGDADGGPGQAGGDG